MSLSTITSGLKRSTFREETSFIAYVVCPNFFRSLYFVVAGGVRKTCGIMDQHCSREASDSLLEPEQTSAPWEMRKRSVVIAGHRTSVSLENAFWDKLKTIAGERGNTVNQPVTEIDGQRSGNLSSAIRLYVLDSLQMP